MSAVSLLRSTVLRNSSSECLASKSSCSGSPFYGQRLGHQALRRRLGHPSGQGRDAKGRSGEAGQCHHHRRHHAARMLLHRAFGRCQQALKVE